MVVVLDLRVYGNQEHGHLIRWKDAPTVFKTPYQEIDTIHEPYPMMEVRRMSISWHRTPQRYKNQWGEECVVYERER